MSRRALRRHHRWRLMRKRKHYHWGWGGETRRNLGRMVNTPKACSCGGCSGNWERRHLGQVTLQERKSSLTMHEHLVTLDEETERLDILG